jgi:hypothetical protein
MPTTQLEQLERIADAFESIARSHATIAENFTRLGYIDTVIPALKEACEEFRSVDVEELAAPLYRIAGILEEFIPTKE